MRNLSVAFTVSLIVAGCGGGGGSSGTSSQTNATSTSVNVPVISFSASRSEINETQISSLNWSVTNASSCTGSGSWSGSIPLSGYKNINYSTGNQTFELSCTGSGGTTSKTVTVKSVLPELSFAGEWYPVAAKSLKEGYNGTIVGAFYELIKIGNQQNYGVAVTGWGYKGWDSTSKESAIVRVGLFEPDSQGSLKLSTSKYISDPETYGGASVLVTNLNNDKYQDIILVSHNETPIVAQPTTVFYGSESGTFTKRTTSDRMAAHDATIINVNGKEKVYTGVVTAHPRNAYYEFVNGELNPTYTPNISYYNNNFWQFGNMSGTLVTNKNGDKVIVTAGGCRLASQSCGERTINVFNFDGYDIQSGNPKQIITPYLSTLPRYTNVTSADGVGQTHVYRVWSNDLNNDGNMDVLAAQSMFNQNSNTYPVALQVLQNNGDNTFTDRTDNLNTEISTDRNNIDMTPVFADLDNTGIDTLFFTQITFTSQNVKHSTYVIVNDGTGKLYLALNKEFENISNDIFKLLVSRGYKFPIPNPTKDWMMPAFMAVPQSDGSVNWLAQVKTTNTNPENGINQVVHLFVNVPFSYNPNKDFSKNIEVADRNNSNKIRTWAGDDSISDKNSVKGTKIDGGMGKNKVSYSGSSTNYTVVKNSDGSHRVTSNTNNIDDTLVRIHNIVFADKTITLE